jgi:hypothetical protein
MLRYNINTGVRKIKTKTAIIGSTIVLGLGGATFGLALPFAAHAAGPGYFQPPTAASVCDAGHGAFAAFSNPSLHGHPGDTNSEFNGQPPYFGDDQLGSARAGVTGAVQKAASEYCNQQ